MLGRLEFTHGGRGRGETGELYGIPVLRVQIDPEGLFGRHHLNRAGRELRRRGVVRTLLPREFEAWSMLEKLGLRWVEPGPFLRAQAPRLAVTALRRRDIDPERATVSLSGARTDMEMLRAAMELCPRVRRLVIAAPDGQRLACRLREEFGMPVLPPEVPAQLDLRFHPGGNEGAVPRLELYGRTPDLDGLRVAAPTLAAGEQGDLSLLCALWEWGKLDVEGLKFI